MTEFKLEDREYIELCDLLKVTGLLDSGGMAKTVISEGCVMVDGRQELRKRCKIHKGQSVEYEGRTILVVWAAGERGALIYEQFTVGYDCWDVTRTSLSRLLNQKPIAIYSKF